MNQIVSKLKSLASFRGRASPGEWGFRWKWCENDQFVREMVVDDSCIEIVGVRVLRASHEQQIVHHNLKFMAQVSSLDFAAVAEYIESLEAQLAQQPV